MLHPLLDQKARNKPLKKREGGAILEITTEDHRWGYKLVSQQGEIFYELPTCNWCGPKLAVMLGVKALAKQGISKDAIVMVKFRDQQPMLRLSECLRKGFWEALQGGSYEAT